MNLVIDVGNTVVKTGIFEKGKLLIKGEFATWPGRGADEWGILLSGWASKFKKDKVKKVVISCVVSSVFNSLKRAIERYFNLSPFEVTPERVEIPLLYDDPHELGTDRIANAVALVELYDLPAMAVDIGTATTFDVVSEDGEYIGGVIAPGIITSLNSLSERTERLFRVEFGRPDRIIGRNTRDNLRSGIFYSCLGAVKEIVGRIEEELGNEARIIATGGLAALVGRECEEIDEVNPDLTLQGLDFIGKKWA